MSNRGEPAISPAAVLDASLLRRWPMPVQEGGDKFSRGTVVVIGGSPRTPGAVRLAGEAALRMGAGRLQIVTAHDAAVPLGVAVPEALVIPLDAHHDGGLLWPTDDRLDTVLAEADAVLIGPGLLGDSTNILVAEALCHVNDHAVVVLDARALSCLCAIPDDCFPRDRLVLTPNRQELAQLVPGIDSADQPHDDVPLAMHAARAYGAALTCFSRVTTADRCWDMGEGLPGLGTSGSGDVLAGLVVGAAARCHDPAQAACWATYAHAQAGASIASRAGELSFLARELVAEIPAVLGAIETQIG